MLSRLMTVREQLLVGGLAAAIAMGSGALVWYNKWGPGAAESPAWNPPELPEPISVANVPVADVAPSPTIDAPASTGNPLPDLSVTVRGAVLREGVYTFSPNDRVHHAIEAAGGQAANADLSDLNLSARLIDGTTLIVPADPYAEAPTRRSRMGAPPSGHFNPPAYTVSGGNTGASAGGSDGAAASGSADGGSLIDLNSASAEQLETLPGIGPRLAERIMAYREQGPFRRIEDLMEVPGIAQGRFDAVRDLITVQ